MRRLLIAMLLAFVVPLAGCNSSTETSTETPSQPSAETPATNTAPTGTADDDCSANIRQFCPGVEGGEGKIAKCLHEHLDDLTPGCRRINNW